MYVVCQIKLLDICVEFFDIRLALFKVEQIEFIDMTLGGNHPLI